MDDNKVNDGASPAPAKAAQTPLGESPPAFPGREAAPAGKAEYHLPQGSPNKKYLHRRRPGNVWITVLKVFAWVSFVLTILCGSLAGVRYVSENYAVLTSLEGILAVSACVLASVLVAAGMIAGTMVVLNMALDISAVRIALERWNEEGRE